MNDARRAAWRQVGWLMAGQHQYITRRQALTEGLTDADIRREVRSGRWVRVDHGMYRGAGAPRTAEADLRAACLATGGWVSHEWAAWLWGLASKPDTQPSVTVPASSRNKRPGTTIHRQAHPRFPNPPRYRTLPCTDLITTLIDFAGMASPRQLDHAVDVALAQRSCSLEALLGELERVRPFRQRGVGNVRASLWRRGLIGAPQPSVLEGMVLRLLAAARIRPIRAEEPVWQGPTRYRIDFTVVEGLALEVDGYVYHSAPEDLRSDLRRRNRIGNRPGWVYLVYTWKDVVEEGDRIVRKVQEAVRALAA